MSVDLLARVLIGWLVLSIIIGGAYAVVMARHKSRAAEARAMAKPYPINVQRHLPPVPWPMKRPPITQADVDETWASVWPSYVEPADIDTLEQRVFDRLFDELVAIEGLEP